MRIRGQLTITGGFGEKKKTLNPIMREELQVLVVDWHKKDFPEHFKTSAVQKYGYEKRSKKYQLRKARKFGHQMPLVWTGNLKNITMSSIKVSTTAKGARGYWSGLPTRYYQYRDNAPDKAKELTIATQEELQVLAEELDKRVTDRLNSLNETTTEVI